MMGVGLPHATRRNNYFYTCGERRIMIPGERHLHAKMLNAEDWRLVRLTLLNRPEFRALLMGDADSKVPEQKVDLIPLQAVIAGWVAENVEDAQVEARVER